MITNAFRATLADDSPVGLCFEPILALANHSCSPTAVVVFDGRSVALRALDSIKKGEQVFISYITATEDRISRQSDLKQRYFFDCQCEKCREDESPYSTFLQHAPKPEGRIDVLCNSEYLIRNAKGLLSGNKETKVRDSRPIYFDKATSYLQQSQTPNAAKELLLKKAAIICDPALREFAIHPMPKIIRELYLTYLDTSSYLNALVILLFLFLNCDVYNYPQPHHAVRVIRLFTIAKLLKHLSSLSPETINNVAAKSNFQSKLRQVIEDIDLINSFHAVMILVWEQGAKSHGKETRFLKEVEGELREVEEVQRLRGDVGTRLRQWMVSENLPGEAKGEGKAKAEQIFLSLRKLSECAWEIIAQ
jgi:SET and MYND domain-containing protein